MGILNYTTSIKTDKTISEIQRCLVDHGATKIVTDYSHRMPTGLTFCLSINDSLVAFNLPSNYRGVLKSMENDRKVPRKYVNEDQALRTSWRIIKTWVEAQMALVEANLADVAEVFLPYAVTKNGQTLYNEIQQGELKLLQQG